MLGSLDKTAELRPRVRKRGEKETVLPVTVVLVCFFGFDRRRDEVRSATPKFRSGDRTKL